MAGSDDGSFFIWDRKTTNIVRVLRGDDSIVNCLQPHPSDCLLATSGIDPVVRLWGPKPQVLFYLWLCCSVQFIVTIKCSSPYAFLYFLTGGNKIKAYVTFQIFFQCKGNCGMNTNISPVSNDFVVSFI